MNNKILITIYVPFIEKKYELYIPLNKKVGYLKQMIVTSIRNQNDNNIDSDDLKLYDKETGDFLQSNVYVKDTKIRNGSILFLI